MIEIEVLPEDDTILRLLAGFEALGKGAIKNTAKAFRMAANDIVAATWRMYALGAAIPGSSVKVKSPKGGYAAGVKVRKLGDFRYRVVNTSKVAPFLEYGTDELDMKKTHPYGWRSRVANKGTKKNPRWVPYLIVPFRWGTGTEETAGHFRNIIPKNIYEMIQSDMKAGSFIRTRVIGERTSSNIWGEEISRNVYGQETGAEGWGSRVEGIGGNIEGLVAMAAESGREKRRSEYFTFRVISAESPARSWIRPAQPAMHIAQLVAENTRERVQSLVHMAIKMDLGVS